MCSERERERERERESIQTPYHMWGIYLLGCTCVCGDRIRFAATAVYRHIIVPFGQTLVDAVVVHATILPALFIAILLQYLPILV
jgi:hypothetical protein